MDALLPEPRGSKALVNVRIVCALLASTARLVPVPFLDDILRERIAQLMVKRTLVAHGRTGSSGRLKAIWADGTGCAEGCVLFALKIPIVLITYPFRKIWKWITAVHGIARDLTHYVLLGRALDRVLARGMLADGAPSVDDEARRVRRAFDNAVAGMDMKVLTSALGDALRKVKGLPSAAVRALRALRRRKRDPESETLELPPSERATVDEGARSIEEVLARADVAALLERFDQRFEENLRVLDTRA